MTPDYGLAGAVWTTDIHRAHRVAAKIRSGTVWINAYRVVAPSVPLGGFGHSGIGRENGVEAIDEYLENKNRAGAAYLAVHYTTAGHRNGSGTVPPSATDGPWK